MNTFTLTIDGMHCGGCVRRVKAVLEATPGVTVKNISVGSAEVALDEAEAKPEAVVSALKRAGYDARTEVAHEHR